MLLPVVDVKLVTLFLLLWLLTSSVTLDELTSLRSWSGALCDEDAGWVKLRGQVVSKGASGTDFHSVPSVRVRRHDKEWGWMCGDSGPILPFLF